MLFVVLVGYDSYQFDSVRASQPPWFDDDCAKLKADKYRLLYKLRRFKCDESKHDYVEAKAKFKRCCREKKAEYDRKLAGDITTAATEGNCKQFWDTVKRILYSEKT